MSRLLSLLLALILLAACMGPTAAPSAPPPSAPPPAPTPTATRMRLARASPEAITTAVPVTPEATRLPHLESPLVWALRSAAQPDLALVNDALNQRLAEHGFNARVELRFVDALHYDQQMAGLAAGGALPDLLTTGGAVYENGVAAGLYHPIAPEDAPGLWQSLPEAAWQAARRGGQVYGVPAVGQWTRPYGVAIRADVLAALDIDPLLPEVKTFNDLTALFERIQAAIDARQLDPALRSALGAVDLLRPEAAGYEPLAAHFVVRVDDPQAQVVNWLQTPAALELARLRQVWSQAGIEPARIPDPAGWLELCQAGRFAAIVGSLGHLPFTQRESPISQSEPTRCGLAWVEKPLAPLFLSTDAITATLTSVGAKDPERARRALLLLEMLRGDPQLYNLLALGIEGRHWQWDNASQWVTLLPEDPALAGYRPDIDTQLGRPDLRYPSTPAQAAAWTTVLDWNARAVVSPALGFRLDPRPSAGPLAAMRGLERELAGPLHNGKVQDVEAALSRLDEQMAALGAGALVSDLARQFSFWRANP